MTQNITLTVLEGNRPSKTFSVEIEVPPQRKEAFTSSYAKVDSVIEVGESIPSLINDAVNALGYKGYACRHWYYGWAWVPS